MSAVPAILVKGPDAALVAQGAHRAVAAILGDRDALLCVEELGGGADDLDVAVIIDAMTTPPFLVDARVVVVRDAGRLSAGDAERIATVLADPVDGVTLVCCAGGGTVPVALQRAIGAVGEVVDTAVGSSLKDRRAFIAQRLSPGTVRLDAAAQERLAAHVGEDLARVDGVLATLAAAYGEGASIGVDELDPFLGATGSVPEWDLTDAITAGDAARSIGVLHRLVGPGGRAAPVVVSILQRHYLRMLRLDGAGARTKEQAAAILSVSPFPAGKLLAAQSALGAARIRRAVAWVAQADGDVKGATALDASTVLEILVARLARLHRSSSSGR